MDIFTDLFFNYTLRTVALGAATLGAVSGALGSFAMLRRQSLLGDAMSHAALPGVVIAFMLTGSKAPFVLLIGAALAGLLGTTLLTNIVRYTRIKEDSALGIILSVFFGFGLMLLTFLQRNPDARQAGLNTFLFGQAATLLERDVITMALFGGTAVILMVIFWKELKLLTFDPEFGASLGFPMRFLNSLLMTLLVVAIVIGLQAVGVVLMSAMVVAPAAAARQWTNRLGLMVSLAALFGAIGGVSGAMISSLGSGLSTGPVVVLCISIIVIFSFLFAPARGVLWNWLKQRRNRQRLHLETVLSNLYTLAQQHDQLDYAHPIATLQAMNFQRGGIENTLNVLAERGWVQQTQEGNWALTRIGINQAKKFAQDR
ncbi:MAG: metal ABC transporter permease [Chloroflexota bacterium]